MDECPECNKVSVDPAKATIGGYHPEGNLAEHVEAGTEIRSVNCDNCGALLRQTGSQGPWELSDEDAALQP